MVDVISEERRMNMTKGEGMTQNANEQPDAADHLRELRREQAEVRSRLVEVTREVGALTRATYERPPKLGWRR